MKRNYVDREYKNNVFCDLFSEKKNALSLYNALNHTAYTDIDDLEIVTLSDVIFMQQKNDVSIMFQNELALWEHQSTLNYNMPLRGLIYFAHNIDGILKSKGITLYGKKIVKIPSPVYYVFYNGTEHAPDRQDLKLSDSFISPTEGYEWTAHMLNINAGHSQELLNSCPVLKGYVTLVQYIRRYRKQGKSPAEAVDLAIDQCIEENMLKEYLLKKKSEVKLMLLTEFDEELFARTMKEEGLEEGIEKGLKKGLEKGRKEGLEKGIQIFIEDNLEEEVPEERIRSKLQKHFGLTEEKAAEYYERFAVQRMR